MPLYPGASVRLLDKRYSGALPMAAFNRVNLHVAAGYGSLFNFFNQPKRASSHFWVAKTGLVEQYVDTAFRAEADLQGNDATISIETESKGEAWTEAQVIAIINLVKWITATHNIPRRLASSSQVGEPSKGISWHRLGINGNFPPLPSRYAGRLQRGGGMQYSLSTGKTCPVEPAIDQIHDRILPGVTDGTTDVTNPLPPVIIPKPPVQPVDRLREDGLWGGDTTYWQQRIAGTATDRVISHQYMSKANHNIYSAQFDKTLYGSVLAKWMQNRLTALGRYHGKIDGLIGDQTVRALQGYYGTTVDGVVSEVSNMVRAMQEEINGGHFLGVKG